MSTKTNSFRIVYNGDRSREEPPDYDIILVHGLKNQPEQSRLDPFLELLLTNAAKKLKDKARVSCIAFDRDELAAGGRTKLRDETEKVLRKIRLLPTLSHISKPRIFFVAYDDGRLVVKNLLTHHPTTTEEIAPRTCGVIFLDPPIRKSPQIIGPGFKTNSNERFEGWSTQAGKVSQDDERKAFRAEELRISKNFDKLTHSEYLRADAVKEMRLPLGSPVEADTVDSGKGKLKRLRMLTARDRRPSFDPVLTASAGELSQQITDKLEQWAAERPQSSKALVLWDEEEAARMARLAASYLSRGDFNDAEILFSRSINLFDKVPSRDRRLTIEVEIRRQRAQTHFFQGFYSIAEEDFKEMIAELQKRRGNASNRNSADRANLQEGTGALEADFHWYHSISILRQGRYRAAIKELEDLGERLERLGPPDRVTNLEALQIRIKTSCHLAVAYAYVGQFEDAEIALSKTFNDLDSRAISDKVNGSRTTRNSDAKDTSRDPRHRPENQSNPRPDENDAAESRVSGRADDKDNDRGDQAEAFIALRYISESNAATVHMLCGDYKTALREVESALQGLQNRWNETNIRALEVAGLKAMLLAFSNKPAEAEALCAKTMKQLMTTVGRDHPLTLEVTDILVNIFRIQARYLHAASTAVDIVKIATGLPGLGQAHPLTLRMQSHQAEACFSRGDYRDAEECLQGVLKSVQDMPEADGDEEKRRPDLLRYQAELALVLCYCGMVDEARRLIVEVSWCQRHLFESHGKGTLRNSPFDAEPTAADLMKTLVDDIQYSEQRGMSSADPHIVHPDLLFSLQVCAEIEASRSIDDTRTPAWAIVQPELMISAFEKVWKVRTAELGPDHFLTLQAEHRLALAHSQLQSLDGMRKARKHLETVLAGRRRVLTLDHPDTLSAEHDLIITRYTLEESFEGLERLRWIYKQQTANPGPNHPDTLKTLLSRFTLGQASQDNGSAECGDELFRRLRDPTVRRQRLMATLSLQRKLASIYFGMREFERSIVVMRDLTETIGEDFSKDAWTARLPLSEMRDYAGQELNAMISAATDEYEHRLGEARVATNPKTREEAVREALALARSVYGLDDLETLETQHFLAESLWQTETQYKRDEALKLMDDVLRHLSGLDEGKFPDGKELYVNRIRSQHQEWHDERVLIAPVAEWSEETKADYEKSTRMRDEAALTDEFQSDTRAIPTWGDLSTGYNKADSWIPERSVTGLSSWEDEQKL